MLNQKGNKSFYFNYLIAHYWYVRHKIQIMGRQEHAQMSKAVDGPMSQMIKACR